MIKFRGFPFFLSILVVAGCDSQGSTEEDGRPLFSDAPAVDRLVADWVAMWNSYDLDQVGNLFLDDDRLTYFSSEKEGLIRGMDAVKEHHRGFDFVSGGNEISSRLWMEEVGIDLLGDAAVVSGIWFFQTDPESTAEPQRGPVTIVCIREDTEWRFVHMNFSSYPDPEATVQDPT